MRINYCISYLGLSGGPLTIAKIAEGLAARGHDVSITTYAVPSNVKLSGVKIIHPNKYVKMFNSTSLKIIDRMWALSGKKAYYEIYGKWPFIKESIPECDINVATDCWSVFPMLLSRKGKAFYHMQHYEPLFFNEQHLKDLATLTYEMPIELIVNSIWLKGVLKEKHNKESTVINPGVIAKASQDSVSAWKEKGKKLVVCYSNTRDWKGFEDAIKAMELVFSARDDVKWIVYGFDPSKLRSEKAPYEIASLPTGQSLAQLYQSADVVFSPSWYESFPAPPIEAMLAGAPVVTTSIGVEDYALNGETAVVVPARDPNAMARGILSLLSSDDLSSRIRKNALEKAKEFTWDKAVDKAEALFLSRKK